ncbi:hypothetical protein [Pseudomonas sp. MF6776]|uniref:hypothetical protein n=1 Tax=Pseudomonas sp. MF6776 TaxID=2797534 RepID=UPI00190D5974|nr:hypothetical protein [Pseudomonas sp. MF6776]MBK3468723.1 hypothetical protein [Pseudomonas sp. MF6776]
MADPRQEELFSPLSDLQAAQWLMGELHDDLPGRVARFQQVNDLCANLGSTGTMIPGEVAYSAWVEARSSFVNGNYVATVMLCQGLAEQMLASHLTLSLNAPELPKKIGFQDTLSRCLEQGVIEPSLAGQLNQLMGLRNPLSHFRRVDDPESLFRRALDSQTPTHVTLQRDATFAISVAVDLLASPVFRLGR